MMILVMMMVVSIMMTEILTMVTSIVGGEIMTMVAMMIGMLLMVVGLIKLSAKSQFSPEAVEVLSENKGEHPVKPVKKR